MSISKGRPLGVRRWGGSGVLLVLAAGLVACTATTSGTGVGAPTAGASSSPTGFPSESSAQSAPVPTTATTLPAGTEASPDGDFAVTVPSGWADASKDPGSGLVTEYIGPAKGGFAPNINVTREPIGSSLTLAQFVQQSQAEVRRGLGAVQFGNATTRALGGSMAAEYAFGDVQGGRALRQRQTLAIHDGFGYVVTYTAVPTQFQPGTDGADDLVDSWQWL